MLVAGCVVKAFRQMRKIVANLAGNTSRPDYHSPHATRLPRHDRQIAPASRWTTRFTPEHQATTAFGPNSRIVVNNQ
jgi:hypothetical protein